MHQPSLFDDDLLKAQPGRKDIAKLHAEVITNKKGVRQTVWKKNDQGPQRTVIDVILEFFGLKAKREVAAKIAALYREHQVKEKYHISAEAWGEHVAEYFKRKAFWDRSFTGGGKTGGGGSQGGKGTGGGKTGGGYQGGEKKTWNKDVMKLLHELYGGKESAVFKFKDTNTEEGWKARRESFVGKTYIYKEHMGHGERDFVHDITVTDLTPGNDAEEQRVVFVSKQTGQQESVSYREFSFNRDQGIFQDKPNDDKSTLVGKKYSFDTTMFDGEKTVPVKTNIIITEIKDGWVKYKDLDGKGSGSMKESAFDNAIESESLWPLDEQESVDPTAALKDLLAGEKKKKPAGERKKPAKRETAATKRQTEKDRYVDVGQKIGGARKDLAALVKLYKDDATKSVTLTDIENLEESEEAGLLVTRERQCGNRKAVATALKNAGAEPGTAYAAWRYVSAIQAKPDDNPESRKRYIMGIERVLKAVMTWKTREDLRSGIEQMLDEYRGVVYTAEEQEHHAWLQQKRKEVHVRRVELSRGLHSMTSRERENDPRLKELEKEDMMLWNQMNTMEKEARKRQEEDPYSIQKLYKSLGAPFAKLLQYDAANRLFKMSRANDSWKWAGLEESEGEKQQRNKKRQETMKWERDVPDKVERESQVADKDYDSKTLMGDYGLRGVEYGNWMDLESSRTHTQRAGEALADLSHILGIDRKMVSLNGRLSLAFGARGKGKAKAHYEPGRKVINLTKAAGGGSLAHEWGHALDNIMGMLSMGGSGGSLSFTSDLGFSGGQMPDDIKAALWEVRQAIHKGNFSGSTTMTMTDPRVRYHGHTTSDVKLMTYLHGENPQLPKETLESVFNEVMAKYPDDKYPLKNPAFLKELFGHEKLAHPDSKRRMYAYFTQPLSSIDEHEIDGILGDNEIKVFDNGPDYPTLSKDKFTEFLQKYVTEKGDAQRQRNESFANTYSGAHYWTKAQQRAISSMRRDIKYYVSMGFKHGIFKQGDKITLSMPSVSPAVAEGKSNFLATAEKMGDYWQRPHELFARSFESYVYDKLAEKKMKNTYLVSGVSKEAAATWSKQANILEGDRGVTSAYPLGEERERINKAMDGLVEALKKFDMFNKALDLLDRLDLRKAVDIHGIEI